MQPDPRLTPACDLVINILSHEPDGRTDVISTDLLPSTPGGGEPAESRAFVLHRCPVEPPSRAAEEPDQPDTFPFSPNFSS